MLQENYGIIVVLFMSALFFSTVILTSQNPIYSLLSLIVTLTSVICIFLSLNIEFLSLTFLIVYIGAIAILFLFVIMMLNIKRTRETKISNEYFYNILLSFVFIPKIFIEFLENLKSYYNNAIGNLIKTHCLENDFIQNYKNLEYILKYKKNDTFIFSDFLYTNYFYCFALIGAVLFSAMVCSIVLALSSSEKTN